jgi:hypothetical protein
MVLFSSSEGQAPPSLWLNPPYFALDAGFTGSGEGRGLVRFVWNWGKPLVALLDHGGGDALGRLSPPLRRHRGPFSPPPRQAPG